MTKGRERIQCVSARWTRGDSHPSGTQQDGVRFHHATQNGTEFRTYELLIPGIFHLTFLARLWVIETTDEGALLC